MDKLIALPLIALPFIAAGSFMQGLTGHFVSSLIRTITSIF